jgi:peptidoglycan/xylan/chitin deacetylase (PgdA/CDA1 family)
LPFDQTEIIDNLRLEKYVGAVNAEISYIADSKSLSRRIYYALRPLFPVRVRRILQRIALQDWSKIPFPAWPVDTTVEDFINWLWVLVLEATGEEQIPFIWYWPESFTSCAIMTHDVETGAGQDFCPTILKLEQEFGIKSSFELVPEVRYEISQDVMEAIRQAGSEVCVHGLNHDGRLFSSEELFRTRAKAINEYAKKWGAKGFRSPVMYRNFAWYDAFKFSYDMSVPNVAHLDPQRGGCCTIFPYFVGDIVELPLTTTQDYPLYNIMRSDPMTMWTKQMDSIVAKHGLVSFIIHPDYTVEQKRQDIYRGLLQMLKRNGDEKNVWLALPGEVDTWWRERNGLTLTREGGTWSVRGKGSDRASVAYAKLENGKLTYVLPNGTTEKV